MEVARRRSTRRTTAPPAQLEIGDDCAKSVTTPKFECVVTPDTSVFRKAPSLWARYESLLIRYPYRMQILQAVIVALLANICNQCLLSGNAFDFWLVAEQLSMNVLLAPATICWLRFLRQWRLHWVTAALVDQLTFNVLANVCMFYTIAAVFRGGVRLLPTLSLDNTVFPSILAYEPIWATRVRGLQTKLPTTLVREKVVPAHLKGAWELLVRFAWSIFIAAKLATWR